MQSNRLRIVFLNLPNRAPLARRYICTYYSPMFMLPPHELLQLATCAREWNQAQVSFLDAIAEERTEADTHAFIADHAAEMVVALTGIESISDDLACMDRIKAAFPNVECVVFGYYPSAFPKEVLEKSHVDLVLLGEPEIGLRTCLEARNAGLPLKSLPGIAGRAPDGSIFVGEIKRLQGLDDMPFPDYGLVDIGKYEEALQGGPCGAVLSARGCPFFCAYCATTYGHALVAKTSETVVDECEKLIRAGAKVIRFLDDTFTYDRERTIAICKGLIERKLRARWTCLSRIDTLDEEMLRWMKKSGCERILIGIESYSRTVLEGLNKRTNPEKFNSCLRLVRKAGIESVGFILLGAPFETDEDFRETLNGILNSPVDFVSVNILTPYAGTPFFERVKNDIVFSLIPYECRYKDDSIGERAVERERTLYMRFYLRPITCWRLFRRFLRFPFRSTRLIFMMLAYKFKHFTAHERPDLF